MTVTIAAVMSLDGKLTRHEEIDVTAWASKEDHDHFTGLIEKSQVIVMGTGTYKVMKDALQLSPERLRVVLTSRPDDYAADTVPGQLEFRSSTADEFVKDIENTGKANILVVGGETMITDFLRAGVVNDAYITIEPLIFGSGKSLVSSVPLDVRLQLIEQIKLNDKGSILLHYKVLVG